MINTDFSYDNLQIIPHPIVRDTTVTVTFPESNYIGLFQKPLDEYNVNLQNRVGWVTYISIRETGENLKNGWNILKDIFLEYHTTFVMLPKREYPLSKPEELGRQITFFQYLSPHVDLNSIIQKIGIALINANIEPGDQPLNLKNIKGSPHLFYQENKKEVIRQRQALEEQDAALAKTENFMSDYFHSSEYALPPNVNLQLALNLLQAYQLFYEIDRRLPMKFSFEGTEDVEGKRIKFDGNVVLAMKITTQALRTILPPE